MTRLEFWLQSVIQAEREDLLWKNLGKFPCDDERDVDPRLPAYLREAGCRARESVRNYLRRELQDRHRHERPSQRANELSKHILIGDSPSTKYQDIRVKGWGL